MVKLEKLLEKIQISCYDKGGKEEKQDLQIQLGLV